LEGLVLEDLIRNVHTLFDDQLSAPPPVLLPAAETTSTSFPSDSFLSAELPQLPGADAIDPTIQRPQLVGVTPTLTQSSFSSLPSDVALDSRLTPSPTTLPAPLLGFPSSSTLVEGMEMNSQEQVTPEVRHTEVMELEAQRNYAPEVVSVPPTFVDEWRLRQSHLPSQPEAAMIPQSPPESVLSSMSDLPLSSVMSL
jgi:hypothetical protein